MTDCISKYCFDLLETAQAVRTWHNLAICGKPYLMAEILKSAMDVDADSKDAQRLSPVVGRFLSELGVAHKQFRGPHGNRKYWIKA